MISLRTTPLSRVLFTALVVALWIAPVAARSASRAPAARSASPLVVDNGARIDINQISMVVTNHGSIAYDVDTFGPGFEFPKGSGKTAVYAAGLWLGAIANAQVRVAMSEYADEYQPGAILGMGFGAFPDIPGLPEYKVYKLNRVYADSTERDAVLADYNFGALPHGAPPVAVKPDGSLDILGDQMLWAVYNDMGAHHNGGGSTAPLGIEVQQTTYAFDAVGPLGSTILVKYRLINKGGDTLDPMYIGQWADPDLGAYTDDLIGSDQTRGLGYAYNGASTDSIYGADPPSMGFDFMQGPRVGVQRIPATSLIRYTNGTDPRSALETYNYLSGRNADGTPIIDPTTSLPATFMVSGDPVGGTGWLDTAPGDRRLLLSAGPITMAPGDTQEVVVAIVVGQGADRLSGITAMKNNDDAVQALFDGPTPALLSLFDARPAAGGLELRWRIGGLERFASVMLERAPAAQGPWAAATVTEHAEGETEVALDRDVEPGVVYHYRLVAITRAGERQILGGIDALAGAAPSGLWLAPARPNPTHGAVSLEYALPRDAHVALGIFDVQGREVARLLDQESHAGRHVVTWDGRAVASGIYFAHFRALGLSDWRRIVIAP